jgi:Helix-turn-helix domain
MDGGALRERLRRARTACGEELSALSRRTGIRLHHLRAIEDGRFGDLPPGIYARAAVRAFAAACGLDPDVALAECEAELPRIADPIDALKRKCGLQPRPTATASAVIAEDRLEHAWHAVAAAAIDTAVVGALFATIVVSAAIVGRVPVSELSAAPTPLALVGFVLGGGYFLWFGGLCGRTLGGLVMHAPPPPHEPLTLRTIAERAWSAATADARTIARVAVRLRQASARRAARSRSAPPPEPLLWPLRLRGRAPVLWSPERPPVVAPPPTPHPRRG